jgi:hypothetical protein
MSVP